MKAWFCESGLGSVGELLQRVNGEAAKAGVEAAIVSKEVLENAGERSLLLAEHLATNERMKGARVSKSVANEFLLWLAKERQVSEAIGKMGAKDAKGFGIVVIGGADGKKLAAFASGLKKAGIRCTVAKFGPKKKAGLRELEKMAVSRIE